MDNDTMDNKDHSFTSLKDILTDLLSGSTLPFNPDDARLWKIWEEAVGSVVAEHASPCWIKNGCLRVDVSDPIWLQELEFAGDSIIDKINSKLGRNAISKIEFRMGQG